MNNAFLASSVLVCLVSACAVSPEGVHTTTDEDRVHPAGPDDSPGSLLVQSARTPILNETLTLAASRGAAAVQHTLDTEFTNVPVGASAWSFSSVNSSFSAATTIASGARTTIRLGAVAITRTSAPDTFGLEVATNSVTGYLSAAAAVAATTFSVGAFISNAGDDGTRSLHVAPGEYVFTWGIADGMKLTVAPGAVVTKALFGPEGRRIARVVKPTRELPNGCTSLDAVGLHRRTGTAPLAYYTTMRYGAELGQATFTSQYDYAFTLPCSSDPLPLPLGAVGAGPLDVHVGRIDVDDVTVTMADGSTRSQRGSYTIIDATTGRYVFGTTFSTNSGVDVMPGTYNITTTYTTSAGTTKTTTNAITIR